MPSVSRIVLICLLAFGLVGPTGLTADAAPTSAAAKVRARKAKPKAAKRKTTKRTRKRTATKRKRRATKRKRRRSKRRYRKATRSRGKRYRKRRRRRRRSSYGRTYRKAYRGLPQLPKAWSYPPSAAMRRRGSECLRSLTQLNVKWRRANRIGRIATPVVIRDANLNGVKIRSVYTKRTVMDCHLARAFAMNAPKILSLGIRQINYSSIHRYQRISRNRRISRHNLGLAMDVQSVITKKGKVLVVRKHYWHTRLKKFIRAMQRTKMFRSVLHPGNDRRHWDHFHFEAKMHTTRRW